MKPPSHLPDLEDYLSDGPQSSLERKLVEQYLAERGYHMEDIDGMPKEKAKQIMVEAFRFASLKLAELESRAKFVDEIRLPD